VLPHETGLNVTTLITSIVVPILTGGALAFLGYRLDTGRRKQITEIENSNRLLDQKLDRQNALYEKAMSLSSENKRQSMLKAIETYDRMYAFY
jgi:hypothetical protein